jgi:tetratricopeptide (TPR) repeat protein
MNLCNTGFTRGRCKKSRQLPSALRVVDEALRLDPINADALVLRGSIPHDLGRIRESNASYRQALALDAGKAEALNNIAVNRLRRGKFGRALRGFLGAAGIDPTLGDLARNNIGALLVRLLRRVTLVVAVLGLFVTVVGSLDSRGYPTVTARLITGLLTAALIAILGWLLQAIPRRLLASVLRARHFLAARLGYALLGVALGAGVTVFGGPAWTMAAGQLLIIGAVFLMWAGLTIGN